ncbi:AAA family ATPase [Hymenobacter ruber]
MLTSLRIQNFRSIRDASVKLGQVNLFIGPNNSGKSNFLKGIEFAGKLISGQKYSESEFDQLITRPLVQVNNNELLLPLERQNLKSIEAEFLFNSTSPFLTPKTDILLRRGRNLIYANTNKFENESSHNLFESSMSYDERQALLGETSYLLKNLLQNSIIYKPDPAKFAANNPLLFVERFDANGNNINNFLFNLSQNHKELFQRLENDFRKCVGSLNSVSTPADPLEKGFLKLKFFDASGSSYWADEVSEGVLYFLALLCIIHQPDPPKLLLLEEPEKGIHPRRIKEVMDFIFELARLRDIQIILTSHSPYVVDHFKDIPECISVFDRDENGETVIRNADDIIKETNDKLKAAGEEEIHYTDALGEYWVSGFLGGVPL